MTAFVQQLTSAIISHAPSPHVGKLPLARFSAVHGRDTGFAAQMHTMKPQQPWDQGFFGPNLATLSQPAHRHHWGIIPRGTAARQALHRRW